MIHAASGSILVVEDDLGVCTLERLRLERAGFQVLTAASAEEAESKLGQCFVEVLILDNHLPGCIDGLEFYQHLQEIGATPPVIMVTGFSDEATAIRALKTGVRDFITKSAEYLDYLPKAVERVLKQVRIERQLAESEARYRKLHERFQGIFQSSRDAISYADLEGRLLEVNEAFARLTGLTRDELLHKKYQDLTPPEYHALQAGMVEHLLRTGESAEFEQEYYHMDQGRVPVDSTLFLVRGSDGQATGLASIIKDITQRKRAEQALHEKEAHLRVFVEHMPAIFFAVDQDLRFVQAMGAGLTALKLAPERVEGLSLFEYFQTESSDFPVIAAARDALQGELVAVELEWQQRWFHLHMEPLRGPEGTITECLGVALDITEQKHWQRHLLRSERLESLGTLAGGIAHDLNNVLTPIVMAVDLLKMNCPDEASQMLLTTLQTSAQRGADMVKQVLSYARGTHGQHQPLQLEPLLKELGRLVQQTFPKFIHWRLALPAGLPTIMGDSTQILQLLMNLCVNARDAMPAGGHLTISAAGRFLDETQARHKPGARPGSYAVLTVEDTGCGIPAHLLDVVFDPFFTTKEQGQGTGLGLFNVAGIVKNHGGFLDLRSEVGKGTCFTIFLPALPGTLPGEDKKPAAGELTDPGAAGEHILVVDDEPGIREVMRITLEAAGYRVLTAVNGADALTVFAQHRRQIRVVIMDLMMPVMDGGAALAALHAIEPNLRAIVASGYQKKQATEIPPFVKAVLAKPFTAQTLLKTVQQTLEQPGNVG